MERAIFAYESAFLGAFSFNTGINRLDFNFVENRPFFLAIHQQVMYDLLYSTEFHLLILMYLLVISSVVAAHALPLNMPASYSHFSLCLIPMAHFYISISFL